MSRSQSPCDLPSDVYERISAGVDDARDSVCLSIVRLTSRKRCCPVVRKWSQVALSLIKIGAVRIEHQRVVRRLDRFDTSKGVALDVVRQPRMILHQLPILKP